MALAMATQLCVGKPRRALRQAALIAAASMAVFSAAPVHALIGETFGNALAGLDICAGGSNNTPDTVILNYTIAGLPPSLGPTGGSGGSTSLDSHAVLHHFWITGNHGDQSLPQIDAAWISYFIDGETTPVCPCWHTCAEHIMHRVQ